jgi:hypothetical protein
VGRFVAASVRDEPGPPASNTDRGRRSCNRGTVAILLPGAAVSRVSDAQAASSFAPATFPSRSYKATSQKTSIKLGCGCGPDPLSMSTVKSVPATRSIRSRTARIARLEPMSGAASSLRLRAHVGGHRPFARSISSNRRDLGARRKHLPRAPVRGAGWIETGLQPTGGRRTATREPRTTRTRDRAPGHLSCAHHSRHVARFAETFSDFWRQIRPAPKSIILNKHGHEREIKNLFDLLAEDSRPNVYAGKLEVRPPAAPTTRSPTAHPRHLPCRNDRAFSTDTCNTQSSWVLV